jgi:hypothetical protein
VGNRVIATGLVRIRSVGATGEQTGSAEVPPVTVVDGPDKLRTATTWWLVNDGAGRSDGLPRDR